MPKRENKEEALENINDRNNSKLVSIKQNKQLKIIILLMIFCLIIIFLPIVIKMYINKFDFIGLNFKKTNIGSVTMYAVKIPITDIKKNPKGNYEFNFKEDPRMLNYIQVDIPYNEVTFVRDLPVYISMEPDLPICSDNIIAVAGLAKFLSEFGNLPVKGAVSEKKYANESKLTFANCEINKNNTVILIKHGNETSIKRTWKNCYEIEYKDCEINKAIERFELIILEKYMEAM